MQILRRIFTASALIIASLAVFPPLAAQADSSVLGPGQTLAAGGELLSPDGHYQLFMQTDGNLVDYSWRRALWASNTAGKSGADLEMQADGNLVIYAPGHVAVWASNTAGHPGASLVIQNDANMVVVSPSGQPLWASGAVDFELQPGQRLSPGWQIQSPDRNYRMVMQSDGNLVLYTGTTAKWASGTSVANSDLEMQSDGNLVIYGPGHAAVWASNTAGKNGSVLFGQNDGNFVLYAPGNVAVWSTNTANSGLGGRIAAIGNAEYQNPAHNHEIGGSNCNYYSYALRSGGSACSNGWRSEEWCADFARWAWGQAGANTAGLTPGAISFTNSRGGWHAGNLSGIQVGDVIGWHFGGSTSDDHVSVVVGINQDGSINILDGNWSNAIGARTIAANTAVSGYAIPTT
jgi:hypothetical protein